MTQIIARTYEHTSAYRAYVTYALLAASAVLAMVYIFNIYTVISHTVALQRISQDTSALAGTIENLDSQYIQLSNNITPDLVHERGMSEGKVSAYISRTASLGVVSMGRHEF